MTRTARPVEDLVWVKDADQIIVINVVDQSIHLLQGEEMAVWDWLSLGYSFTRVAHMLAELGQQPLADAEKSLEKMVLGWVASGLLQVTEQVDG